MLRIVERSKEDSSSEEIVNSPSLYLVGLALDGRATISLEEQKDLPSLVAIAPFAFLSQEEGKLSFLIPFPLRETGLSEDERKQVNEKFDVLLKEQFSVAYGVEQESLGFKCLEDGDFPPMVRHEMGYHLLNRSEDESLEIPDSLKKAFRNTGLLFLLSVGVDRWLNKEERPPMYREYKERFEPFFGPLKFKVLRGDLKRNKGVEFTDVQLEFLSKAKVSVKQVEGIHDIIELGEGYIYTAKQLTKKGVTFELITESADLYPNLPGYPFKTSVLSLT